MRLFLRDLQGQTLSLEADGQAGTVSQAQEDVQDTVEALKTQICSVQATGWSNRPESAGCACDRAAPALWWTIPGAVGEATCSDHSARRGDRARLSAAGLDDEPGAKREGN